HRRLMGSIGAHKRVIVRRGVRRRQAPQGKMQAARGCDETGSVARRFAREDNRNMKAVAVAAAAVLAALAAPALAQDQQGTVERAETPQGTATTVRPTPRAQPATPAPYVTPDPVPPPPVTPFPTDQDRSSQYNSAPYAGTTAPYAPYPY